MDELDYGYCDWVSINSDELLDLYIEQFTDFPESVYEGVLDDDYPEAEENYCMNLTIEDVPDEWLRNQYTGE